MRGIYTSVTEIRRKIFTEVARLAYEGGDYSRIEKLPYKIIPGERASHRESIFLERAIVGERLRLCIGLSLQSASDYSSISEGIDESAISENYYEPPLINIIKFACNSCPDNKYYISDCCQGCLAHPCVEVCPKKAVSLVDGRAKINQDLCVKCGLCHSVCEYHAVIKMERPCVRACGMDAISSDDLGRAQIDYGKCVSCGMCLVNCPFGAISDKSQIFQLILALKSGAEVYAAVAPSFVGQFGKELTPEKLRSAMKMLGFKDVALVAVGADLCAREEAEDFLEKVPKEQPFMGTSCCPSWSVMAKKLYPEFASYISMTLTPMALTGRMIKKEHPDCKVVFIGPCSAKKLEASRKSVKSDIDFVLTYEELMGIFEAKEIDFKNLQEEALLSEATATGRGFAVGGGVAKAVLESVKKVDPEIQINTMSAQGLAECRKMLDEARTGKYNGYLLEGMGCPGGCIAGAGTLQPVKKSLMAVNQYIKKNQK
jgi:[FeFe] hydrogenase (group B1/B3)